MDDKFAVLLANPELFNLPAIAKVLSEYRGVHPHDAINEARAGAGLLLENADEKAAQDLAGRFTSAGLPARVTAQANVPILPEPQLVTGASFLPDKLEIALEASHQVTLPPKRFLFVGAGSFAQTTFKTIKVKEGPSAGQKIAKLGVMLATGLPIPIGGKEKMVEKKIESSDRVFCAELIVAEPFQHLRIEGDNMSYACLKDKMGYNVMTNFPLLMKELIKVSAGAILGRGARVLQANGPVRDIGYGSVEEMEREARWLLALASG